MRLRVTTSARSPDPAPSGRTLRARCATHQSGGVRWSLLLAVVTVPILAVLAAGLVFTLAMLLANDRLPSLDAVTDYRPKIPLRVYSADGVLIGEFGEERRSFVRIEDVPPVMKNAVLAAEDARFFEHAGIDLLGIARAALSNLFAGGREQGASTITQQVARNFFLSSEKTYTRKIYEILLALRIEESLTKDEILELYLNQIFLGKRAYGFASAAQIYFGKPLTALSAAEAAMLAGLPKAPSLYNPLVNPRRATERQRYILGRMRDAGFLSEAEYRQARDEQLHFASPANGSAMMAPYVAELARQLAFDLFHEDVYTAGLNVYTTILASDQRAATAAVRRGVIDYDRKYGYRGPEGFVDLPSDQVLADDAIEDAVSRAKDVDEFLAAVVLSADPKSVRVSRGNGSVIEIHGDGLKFAARTLGDRAPADRRLRRGSLVRIIQTRADGWEITQLPEVQAALVAANTSDGAIRALVGGFDFSRNKFNRVTQAWRQPGSSFKPFIYSAALEKGFSPTTMINDTPLFFDSSVTGGQPWEPKNYEGGFEGPMTMKRGLARSRNMISIRILQTITPQFGQEWVSRFGFDADKHPAYLTMALGAGSVTPMQLATGFAVFANGGYRVNPFLITRVTDHTGRILVESQPAGPSESNRAIDARNAFIMHTMLQDVTRSGTASRAQAALKRTDIAGKTGTTNDSIDAWFAGYQPNLVAVVWMGYDTPRNLGARETGGGLSLPIWINYMQSALKGAPVAEIRPPEGVVKVGGDWYYEEYARGGGISNLGGAGLAPPEPEPMPESGNLPAPSEERNRILDLFKN